MSGAVHVTEGRVEGVVSVSMIFETVEELQNASERMRAACGSLTEAMEGANDFDHRIMC